MNKTGKKYIAFQKAINVIESCITYKQLTVAMKYVHFHLHKYRDDEMYKELLMGLRKKQSSIFASY